jgi:hypothetical protein
MCAVTSITVLFCISLISCFPDMLPRYCKSDFERVPVAHIITGITFDFTFHIHWLSIMRFLYLKIIAAYFLIKFLSPEFAASIKMHIPLLLSRIMKSGLLIGIVLSVHICRFHNVANGCSLSNLTAISLLLLFSVCTFAKLRKSTITFVLSVRMEQFRSHYTDFHEIWKFEFPQNTTKITGTVYGNLRTFMILSRSIHLTMKNV